MHVSVSFTTEAPLKLKGMFLYINSVHGHGYTYQFILRILDLGTYREE